MILNLLNLYSLMFSFIYKISSSDENLQYLKVVNDNATAKEQQLWIELRKFNDTFSTTTILPVTTTSLYPGSEQDSFWSSPADFSSTSDLSSISDFMSSSENWFSTTTIEDSSTTEDTNAYEPTTWPSTTSILNTTYCYTIIVNCSKSIKNIGLPTTLLLLSSTAIPTTLTDMWTDESTFLSSTTMFPFDSTTGYDEFTTPRDSGTTTTAPETTFVPDSSEPTEQTMDYGEFKRFDFNDSYFEYYDYFDNSQPIVDPMTNYDDNDAVENEGTPGRKKRELEMTTLKSLVETTMKAVTEKSGSADDSNKEKLIKDVKVFVTNEPAWGPEDITDIYMTEEEYQTTYGEVDDDFDDREENCTRIVCVSLPPLIKDDPSTTPFDFSTTVVTGESSDFTTEDEGISLSTSTYEPTPMLTEYEKNIIKLREVQATKKNVSIQLTSMCWETSLGQELMKIVVFDTVSCICFKVFLLMSVCKRLRIAMEWVGSLLTDNVGTSFVDRNLGKISYGTKAVNIVGVPRSSFLLLCITIVFF